MRILTLLAAVVLLPSLAQAKITNITCIYDKYSSPDGLSLVGNEFKLVFLMDSNTKKSYITGNNSSEEVKLIDGDSSFTFVEITATGNIMTTTITKGGESVHSRNSVMFGKLIPSQYYGTCTRK